METVKKFGISSTPSVENSAANLNSPGQRNSPRPNINPKHNPNPTPNLASMINLILILILRGPELRSLEHGFEKAGSEI